MLPASATPLSCLKRIERLGAQVQAPVVAGHEVPLRELELARLQQLEAELAADRVRRCVVDIREGVHEAVLAVILGNLDRLPGCCHRDATALELRHDHPADLVDLVVAPLLRPETDRADAGAARRVDDLEHAIAPLETLVATLALAQLVRTLGAAEVLSHARVAHQPLEQRQVSATPGLKGHNPSPPARRALLASLNDLYATVIRIECLAHEVRRGERKNRFNITGKEGVPVAKTEVERRVAITYRREDRRRRASCTLDDLHP